MNIENTIRLHNGLRHQSRSYDSINSEGYRFITQNLSKPSRNTDWVKGDPDNRKLTWVFHGGKYVGYVREYVSKGVRIIEIHKTNPDRLVHTVKEDLCPI